MKTFALLILLATFTSCTMYDEIQEMKKPNYEVGQHRGAEFCAECHSDIYEEWSTNSRHAVATVDPAYLDMLDRFTDDFMLDMMMGEDMCWACHGSKDVNEGVNCETCHGIALADVSIEETHELKYEPGMAGMREEDFCAGCHVMKDPMSGTMIMTVFDEWHKSEAAVQGITCQGCHMEPQGDDHSYHGFDAVIVKDGIYADDLEVSDIRLDFPELTLSVENRINAHAIPAACETRALVLEIDLLDSTGANLHTLTQTFAKRFELFADLMPSELIENTQLQASEVRQVTFELPSDLKGKISAAHILLRFYRVSDKTRDDLQSADWKSEPIVERRVSL